MKIKNTLNKGINKLKKLGDKSSTTVTNIIFVLILLIFIVILLKYIYYFSWSNHYILLWFGLVWGLLSLYFVVQRFKEYSRTKIAKHNIKMWNMVCRSTTIYDLNIQPQH